MENVIGKYARRRTTGSTDHRIESQTGTGIFTNCGRYMHWEDRSNRPLVISDFPANLCRQCA